MLFLYSAFADVIAVRFVTIVLLDATNADNTSDAKNPNANAANNANVDNATANNAPRTPTRYPSSFLSALVGY